ncbi:MAG: hypothetical protein ACOX1G_03020 [bacterium]
MHRRGYLEFAWSGLESNFEVVWSHTGHYPTVMLENLSDLVWVGEELNPWYANEGRIPDLDGLAEYFEHTSNTQRMIDSQILGSWSLLPRRVCREDCVTIWKMLMNL